MPADTVTDGPREDAERTTRERQVMTLSVRDSEAFIQALLNPPEPNEALYAAARLHKELLGEW